MVEFASFHLELQQPGAGGQPDPPMTVLPEVIDITGHLPVSKVAAIRKKHEPIQLRIVLVQPSARPYPQVASGGNQQIFDVILLQGVGIQGIVAVYPQLVTVVTSQPIGTGEPHKAGGVLRNVVDITDRLDLVRQRMAEHQVAGNLGRRRAGEQAKRRQPPHQPMSRAGARAK